MLTLCILPSVHLSTRLEGLELGWCEEATLASSSSLLSPPPTELGVSLGPLGRALQVAPYTSQRCHVRVGSLFQSWGKLLLSTIHSHSSVSLREWCSASAWSVPVFVEVDITYPDLWKGVTEARVNGECRE